MLKTNPLTYPDLQNLGSHKDKIREFRIPPELEAGEPPEIRGLARDEVRLMVSDPTKDRVIHSRFHNLLDFLKPNDVLVINTSATMNAALEAVRGDGTLIELHLSTQLPGDLWVVELRQLNGNATQPFFNAVSGEEIALPGGAQATLHIPYRSDQRTINGISDNRIRLWIASLNLPNPLQVYLNQFGFPIRYKYVRQGWPLSYYQTVYATEAGSAEMPSAGRAFSQGLITRLVASGIQIVPLILHTGVASLEDYEPPYEEYYLVPVETARVINTARPSGQQRIIAVGTTVVRALETVSDRNGIIHPGKGLTDLVITPQRGLHIVDALITGFHEPQSTHLMILETLANRDHIHNTYMQALQNSYLWHEFGDLHLLWSEKK